MAVPAASPLTVGSVYRFRLTAKKDGVVWNLTGATVQLLLRNPSGTTTTYAATLTEPTEGIADYTSSTGDLSVIGGWRRSWKVTQGTVIQNSLPVSFSVQAAP